MVTIKNFPFDRQVAVGITSSYLGLSAKLYTSAVNAIETSSPNKRAKLYLLFNSIFPLLACVVTSPVVRELDDHAEKSSSRRRLRVGFVFMFVVTIVTGCYAVLGSLDLSGSKALLPPVKNLIGIVACLLAPLVIPLGEKIRGFVEDKRLMNRVKRVHNSTNIEEVSSRLENGEVTKEEEGHQLRDDDDDGIHPGLGVKEEIGAKLMLQRVDFWLYFFVYFSGATLGLVFLNNLGQIAESRGCSGTSSLVSLSSSFGFFGRLIPSLFDYFFSRGKYMIPSPASIAALMAPMAGAFMLLLNETNVALYTSTALIGVCSGAITSISVTTTTELFGTKNFSVNHNLVVANIPIGSFLFGYLAALVYHKEGRNAYDGKCMGMACYRSTFIFWGFFCLFGTFLALILYARTRKFYSQRH